LVGVTFASFLCTVSAQVAYLVGDLRAGRLDDGSGTIYAGSSLGWYVVAVPATAGVGALGSGSTQVFVVILTTLSGLGLFFLHREYKSGPTTTKTALQTES